jgi:hypothetical protein
MMETCNKGHPRTSSTTYINPTTGKRHCRMCKFIRYQLKKLKKSPPKLPEYDRCDAGHPFDVENTFVNPRTGVTYCKTCADIRYYEGLRQQGHEPRPPQVQRMNNAG